MSQLPEIPASAYTTEMNTLGAILDILIFEGERVPVSRNALTLGTRSLQLLSLPSTEFPVDLGKTRAGGSSTDASAFWDLLDPLMRSRVVAASFGDYAAGLCRTLPRFPPAMRYALMEQWNDCTHTFIFGFVEMTLTPADYTAITGLGFDGPVAPLDARYQIATLGAELVRTLLGVPTRTRYTAQGYVSYEVVYRFWAERIRSRLAARRELPADARPAAPAYTREERDQAARSFIFYLISSQLLCTSQNKRDPAVLACLRDLSRVDSYDWATLALAHLYHGLDVWAYEYRIYPGGSGGDASADTRRIPRYLAHRHHAFSSIEDPHYWRCYLNDKALSDLLLTPWEGEAWEAYPAREVVEAYTRSRFLLRGYWLDWYFLGERIFELQVATAQRRVPDAPPCHMCLLEGMTPKDILEEYDGSPADIPLSAGDYATYFSTRLQARLPKVREYIQDRKKHRTPAYYRAQAEAEAEATAPAGPAGAVLGDVPFPPGMEVALDPALGLRSAIIIPADLRIFYLDDSSFDIFLCLQVPAQRYQELYQRFGFARSYIAWLYPELHERDLENGRLWRHQPRQYSAVTRLQMEVDRLRTRLGVEGIPLDFSEDEEDDDDGSSSDDAPPSAPSQAAAGPSRRQRINAQLPERSMHKCPSNHHRHIAALCPVYLPDGINLDQGLPLEPFLNRVLSMDVDPSWVRACCFLLLNTYAMKNRQPGIGDFRLLTVVRDMQMYRRTVFMRIMGETMCWVRDITLHVTNFNVHHRGCPMLLQAWALDKLSLIPLVPARLIPTYGPAHFRPQSRGHFDFGDNPVIRDLSLVED
ncbi:hypothetical protein JCGZ_03021 [Jatropha curcas]|uniref:Aminotransferase-like plant mobile domain-containing protein n=1 Tax=Jatropha curcas TaxID=180498 RepID=A0A067LDJ5_JATCU|nr:hypothetical protein JCGZ_03021 [Jatropha curcas]